jgi:hypothetical protein
MRTLALRVRQIRQHERRALFIEEFVATRWTPQLHDALSLDFPSTLEHGRLPANEF